MPSRSRPPTRYEDACNFFFCNLYPEARMRISRAPNFSHGIPFRQATQTCGFEQQVTALGSVIFHQSDLKSLEKPFTSFPLSLLSVHHLTEFHLILESLQ